jgi:hypothetical protein
MPDFYTTNFTGTDCLIIQPYVYIGRVETFAGTVGVAGDSDGGLGVGSFRDVYAINADQFDTDHIDVVDFGSSTIRQMRESDGVITTMAGSPLVTGGTDGTGSVARFNQPLGTATDDAGLQYIVDYLNHTIRAVTKDYNVSTFAGISGSAGATDGTGSVAQFNVPREAACFNNLIFIADGGNHTIRKITEAGMVSTFAGLAGVTGSTDGTGSDARFNGPRAICVDKFGTLYVSDTDNSTIRVITQAGMVSTLAGSVGVPGAQDGTGSGARFSFPRGLWHDGLDGLYLADSNNHAIRKIYPSDGRVETFAGTLGVSGSADGVRGDARFNTPASVTGRFGGSVMYIADRLNYTIRRIT